MIALGQGDSNRAAKLLRRQLVALKAHDDVAGSIEVRSGFNIQTDRNGCRRPCFVGPDAKSHHSGAHLRAELVFADTGTSDVERNVIGMGCQLKRIWCAIHNEVIDT